MRAHPGGHSRSRAVAPPPAASQLDISNSQATLHVHVTMRAAYQTLIISDGKRCKQHAHAEREVLLPLAPFTCSVQPRATAGLMGSPEYTQAAGRPLRAAADSVSTEPGL